MYVDSALYLDTMNDIHTHNEYAFFYPVCDVELFVTEVCIPINRVERFDEKMGTAHLSSFFTMTSPASCICMVVETKGSWDCNDPKFISFFLLFGSVRRECTTLLGGHILAIKTYFGCKFQKQQKAYSIATSYVNFRSSTAIKLKLWLDGTTCIAVRGRYAVQYADSMIRTCWWASVQQRYCDHCIVVVVAAIFWAWLRAGQDVVFFCSESMQFLGGASITRTPGAPVVTLREGCFASCVPRHLFWRLRCVKSNRTNGIRNICWTNLFSCICLEQKKLYPICIENTKKKGRSFQRCCSCVLDKISFGKSCW